LEKVYHALPLEGSEPCPTFSPHPPIFSPHPPMFSPNPQNIPAHLLTRGISIVPTRSLQRCVPYHLHSVGKESEREVSGGREGGVRGEGGDGQGEHLVACTIVAGCTSTAITAAGRRDKQLLLTPAMSAHILILVKVTHITCCSTYSFCKATLSRALAELTFGWRCTLLVALWHNSNGIIVV
jgi:hypothetical protein